MSRTIVEVDIMKQYSSSDGAEAGDNGLSPSLLLVGVVHVSRFGTDAGSGSSSLQLPGGPTPACAS